MKPKEAQTTSTQTAGFEEPDEIKRKSQKSLPAKEPSSKPEDFEKTPEAAVEQEKKIEYADIRKYRNEFYKKIIKSESGNRADSSKEIIRQTLERHEKIVERWADKIMSETPDMSQREKVIAKIGAMLHDCGKLGLDPEFLRERFGVAKDADVNMNGFLVELSKNNLSKKESGRNKEGEIRDQKLDQFRKENKLSSDLDSLVEEYNKLKEEVGLPEEYSGDFNDLVAYHHILGRYNVRFVLKDTIGSTIDGVEIDEKMVDEIAECSYRHMNNPYLIETKNNGERYPEPRTRPELVANDADGLSQVGIKNIRFRLMTPGDIKTDLAKAKEQDIPPIEVSFLNMIESAEKIKEQTIKTEPAIRRVDKMIKELKTIHKHFKETEWGDAKHGNFFETLEASYGRGDGILDIWEPERGIDDYPTGKKVKSKRKMDSIVDHFNNALQATKKELGIDVEKYLM